MAKHHYMPETLSSRTLSFLRNLSLNNNREWFYENKHLYSEAKDNVERFAEDLILEVGKFDEEILKTDARKALFRIYRDIRFSLDKTPYKTHFGLSLGMGKGSKSAGYYMHIEPGKSFLAGGIYNPESSALKDIRLEISAHGAEFLKILEHHEFRNNFRGLSVEHKLKRIPTAFEKDHPMAEYLKLKSFTVSHPVSDEALIHPNAAHTFAQILKSAKPLNDFLNSAFNQER